MYINILKRFFDFSISIIGLIILGPVFIMVLLLLMLSNKGNPFFFQKRPGKNEKVFKIIKFKTMNDEKDIYGVLLSDKMRLTKFGKFVRTSSLDELPQLLNVIKGDMSLIGPRPLLPEYLSIYSERQKKRHNVKPGITGWAQINGRNGISWAKKIDLDIWYVNNISFSTDFMIFVKTFMKVFKREGISADNHVTIEKFNGKN
jgi:lipopolysaccharide/colanic/teichoic acid biosynthesis glycosyltransferase